MSWTSNQVRTAVGIFKDLVLTGLGMWCIYSQVSSSHPSGIILGTGLALTVPNIADHVRALLPESPRVPSSGGGEESSLPPVPSPPQLP